MRRKINLFLIIVLLIILFSNLAFSSNLNSGELKVTEEHPFYVNNNWISASQLQVGDLLTTIDGKKAVIKSIEDIILDKPIPVYNLEANPYHDFVSNQIIVHNSERPLLGKTSVESMEPVDLRFVTKNTEKHISNMRALAPDVAKFMQSDVVPEQYRWSAQKAANFIHDVSTYHDFSKMLKAFQEVENALFKLNYLQRQIPPAYTGYPIDQEMFPEVKKLIIEIIDLHQSPGNYDMLHAFPEIITDPYLRDMKALELVLDTSEARTSLFRASLECHAPGKITSQADYLLSENRGASQHFLNALNDFEKANWYLKAVEYSFWKDGKYEYAFPTDYIPPPEFFEIP